MKRLNLARLRAAAPRADYAVEVSGMSTAMTTEYRDALEALEAVQRHAFAVNSHYATQPLTADEPPPEPEDADLDEAASDDDLDRSSRRTPSFQVM